MSDGLRADPQEGLEALRELVAEQAEDEALWAIYPFGQQPIVEAYLQQELRRLHAAVEAVLAAVLVGDRRGQAGSGDDGNRRPSGGERS